MIEEKENIENNKETEVPKSFENSEKSENKKTRPNTVRAFLDGTLFTREIIIKQFPFVLFLTLIAVAFIANRYGAEKIIRDTQIIKNELKELRAEQISVTSELMQISRQSEVAKLVIKYQLGLSESVEPPKIIVVKDKK
ncbi:MAG: hypothetical protein COX07_07750 [Bacteroidetes bacterium CG23_combo_of_CG06-09_8_20_14_all_32_9]|nr:MAG: hypothetical protein COX07_07750 [Bacteroidetes bacterium CG23_combo_of_CG06-09_8_20_14_all_32_9]